MYVGLVLVMRFLLRRDIGSLSMPDVLFVVLVADASQNAMAGEYKSVADGLVLVGTLVAWNLALDWLSFRSARFRRFIEPRALPLIVDGKWLRQNLKKEWITTEEVLSEVARGRDRGHQHGPQGRARARRRAGRHPPRCEARHRQAQEQAAVMGCTRLSGERGKAASTEAAPCLRQGRGARTAANDNACPWPGTPHCRWLARPAQWPARRCRPDRPSSPPCRRAAAAPR